MQYVVILVVGGIAATIFALVGAVIPAGFMVAYAFGCAMLKYLTDRPLMSPRKAVISVTTFVLCLIVGHLVAPTVDQSMTDFGRSIVASTIMSAGLAPSLWFYITSMEET